MINTNRSALYLMQQQTLPTPPLGFVETNQPVVAVPTFTTLETNRLSGAMNTQDTTVDLCRTSSSFLASVDLRATGTTNLPVVPDFAELLKVSGFEANTVPPRDTYELFNTTKNIPKGSALVFMDDKKFSFTNTLVGSSEIVLEVGKQAILNTTLSGYIDDAIPANEPNPTATLSKEALIIVGCANVILLDGQVVPAQKIVFKTNPEIANTYTMGGTQGIKADTIVDYALTCEITFPVDSANFGTSASMIKSQQIASIRVVVGEMEDQTHGADGQSILFIADTAKATTYADSVNNKLLQRVLTLRLYDSAPNHALRILTGAIKGL